MDVRIRPDTLAFLRDLDANNQRPWFEAHRDRYEAARSNVADLTEALIQRMARHDRLATDSAREAMTRIFADQRFHKDRPPYLPRFGARLARVKPALRGGYFFQLKPGASRMVCGFTAPDPADLRLIRNDIAHAPDMWRHLLGAAPVRRLFGTLTGEQLRTAPQGFPKDHPAIDLLRHKQFLLVHPLSDARVTAPGLVDHMDEVFRSVRPWFDHMSELLTSDGDGLPSVRPRR